MMWANRYRVPMHPANMWRNELRRVSRQMDYRFGGTRGPIGIEYPRINAWSSDESLLIVAELPGADMDQLDISLEGRSLTVSGLRASEQTAEDIRQHRVERISGEFSRSIELPFDVDVDAVEAKYDGGLLEIRLPRLAEEKPRTISVNIE